MHPEIDDGAVPGEASIAARGQRRRRAAALVLVGELTYLLVALAIQDPVRYATPLLLMFPSFVAAWFLERRGLLLTMAATKLACFVALEHSRLGAAGIAIQLILTAGVLNATTVGLFLLRRRVERLLRSCAGRYAHPARARAPTASQSGTGALASATDPTRRSPTRS